MNDDLRLEKRILRVSFAGSVFFLLIECVMVFATRSHALLTDCVYDVADVLMLGPFMLLVPLLYKPETEKRPYGFSQVESLFIMIKCVLLLIVTSQLIFESGKLLLQGGHAVNAGAIAAFELGMSAACIAVYGILRYLNKKYSSPTVKIELYVWKMDALSTLGVGAAFVVQLILQRTSLAWIAPYIDPAVAILMAVILLKEPVCMFCEGIRNLILFAPKEEVIEHVREVTEAHLEKYRFGVNFLDVIKTGRKLWIEVYILGEDDRISIRELKKVRGELIEELKKEYDNIDIELIPELDDPRNKVPQSA